MIVVVMMVITSMIMLMIRIVVMDALMRTAAAWILAKQERLEFLRTAEDAGCGGSDAQLDQQINENEALFHSCRLGSPLRKM